MLKLSAKWGPILVSQPEAGMGYWVASVSLRDGKSTVIIGDSITQINGSHDIPFNEDEIVDIKAERRY
jgi:hypothetical protein